MRQPENNLGRILMQGRQHLRDQQIPDAVSDKAAGKIGHHESGQQKHADDLPGRYAPWTPFPGNAPFRQYMDLQHTPYQKQEQHRRQQIQEHFPVACQLVADVDEQTFPRPLLPVAHIVARRRQKADESQKRPCGPRREPE